MWSASLFRLMVPMGFNLWQIPMDKPQLSPDLNRCQMDDLARSKSTEEFIPVMFFSK
eukprot:gene2520-1827_t